MDYRTLSLQFYSEGKFVTLTGERNPIPQMASVHQLYRLSSVKSIAQCYQLTRESVEKETIDFKGQVESAGVRNDIIQWSNEMPDTLRQLLLKYQEVFEIPKGLPPSRLRDHKIPLQANANPVKVRPYRYPHSQKTEIERMV